MALPEDVRKLGVHTDFSPVHEVQKANLEVPESFLATLTHYSIGVTGISFVVELLKAIGQVLDHLIGRLEGQRVARLVQRIQVSHRCPFGTVKDEGHLVLFGRKPVPVTS